MAGYQKERVQNGDKSLDSFSRGKLANSMHGDQERNINLIAKLPYKLLLYVLSFCDPSTLLRFSKVSWYCKLVTDSNAIWKAKCKQRGWNLVDADRVKDVPTNFWKRYYYEKQHLAIRISNQKNQHHAHNKKNQSSMSCITPRIGIPPQVLRRIPYKPRLPSGSNLPSKSQRSASNPSMRKSDLKSIYRNETQGRLVKVPASYITGVSDRRPQSCCETLVNLPSNARLVRPQLPSRHVNCISLVNRRPQSTDSCDRTDLYRNAISQRYNPLGKLRSSRKKDSVEVDAPEACYRDVATHAEVFGATFMNDLESVSQFSLWDIPYNEQIPKPRKSIIRYTKDSQRSSSCIPIEEGGDEPDFDDKPRNALARTKDRRTVVCFDLETPPVDSFRSRRVPDLHRPLGEVNHHTPDDSASSTDSINSRLGEFPYRNDEIRERCSPPTLVVNEGGLLQADDSLKIDVFPGQPVPPVGVTEDSVVAPNLPDCRIHPTCPIRERSQHGTHLSMPYAHTISKSVELTMVSSVIAIKHSDIACLLNSEQPMKFEQCGLRRFVLQRRS